MLDIKNASKEQLIAEYENCMDSFSNYSYSCLGYYISALHDEIVKQGGWPSKQNQETPKH